MESNVRLGNLVLVVSHFSGGFQGVCSSPDVIGIRYVRQSVYTRCTKSMPPPLYLWKKEMDMRDWLHTRPWTSHQVDPRRIDWIRFTQCRNSLFRVQKLSAETQLDVHSSFGLFTLSVESRANHLPFKEMKKDNQKKQKRSDHKFLPYQLITKSKEQKLYRCKRNPLME
jgi:hypothetical protein